MKIQVIVIVCGSALLLVAVVAVVVASRNRQPGLPPDVPVVASPAEVRVKAVERNPAAVVAAAALAAPSAF